VRYQADADRAYDTAVETFVTQVVHQADDIRRQFRLPGGEPAVVRPRRLRTCARLFQFGVKAAPEGLELLDQRPCRLQRGARRVEEVFR
jgi:hypothetical protein